MIAWKIALEWVSVSDKGGNGWFLLHWDVAQLVERYLLVV